MSANNLVAQLDLLDQYLSDLGETRAQNYQAYESDKMLRRYTERMLQMAAEACIRIGIAVLTREGLRDPENHHDIFIVLGEHGILPRDLVDSMTAMIELRNLLVYEHSSVDDAMVYGFTKKRLNDFVAFSIALRQYCARSASPTADERK